MPPSKSAWNKDLKQAQFWFDGQDFLLSLNSDGSVVWDGPAVNAIRRPSEAYPESVIDWLETMRDTFRDAARAAREIADGNKS